MDDEVLLSAQVQFELSSAVEDALLKGIPMYFVARRTSCASAGTGTTSASLRCSGITCAWPTSSTRRWRLNVNAAPGGNQPGIGPEPDV